MRYRILSELGDMSPADSIGIVEILEHSVLCGLRKFPIKDHFIRLAGG